MPASHTVHRLVVTFDDIHAVADAGLILPATLGQHLGLREPLDAHVDVVVDACTYGEVRFSTTAKLYKGLHARVAAIAED